MRDNHVNIQPWHRQSRQADRVVHAASPIQLKVGTLLRQIRGLNVVVIATRQDDTNLANVPTNIERAIRIFFFGCGRVVDVVVVVVVFAPLPFVDFTLDIHIENCSNACTRTRLPIVATPHLMRQWST